MSSGEADNRRHSFEEWCAFCQENPELLEHLHRPRRVSYDYDVPYLGGISKDGNVVYIDRNYNPTLRLSSGPFDSAYAIPDHEITEWFCVTILGMDYDKAHVWGNTAEGLAVTGCGVMWNEYNKAIDAKLPSIEHEQITNAPPDLALYPYNDSPALLEHLQSFQ